MQRGQYAKIGIIILILVSFSWFHDRVPAKDEEKVSANVAKKQTPLFDIPQDDFEIDPITFDVNWDILDPIELSMSPIYFDKMSAKAKVSDMKVQPIPEVQVKAVEPVNQTPEKKSRVETPSDSKQVIHPKQPSTSIQNPENGPPSKEIDSEAEPINEVIKPVVDPLLDDAIALIDQTIATLTGTLDTISDITDQTLKNKLQADIEHLTNFKQEITSANSVSKTQIDELNKIHQQATSLKNLAGNTITNNVLPLHLVTKTLLNVVMEPLDALSNTILKL